MNTPLIEKAILKFYGERCRVHVACCLCCKAWHELDTLKAKNPSVEELKAFCCEITAKHDAEMFRWFFKNPAGRMMFLIKGLSEFDSLEQWRSAMRETIEDEYLTSPALITDPNFGKEPARHDGQYKCSDCLYEWKYKFAPDLCPNCPNCESKHIILIQP